MESHPGHISLSPDARSEALAELSWFYAGQLMIMIRPCVTLADIPSDYLFKSSRSVPPPFSQDECQGLIKLLETLGEDSSSDSCKL